MLRSFQSDNNSNMTEDPKKRPSDVVSTPSDDVSVKKAHVVKQNKKAVRKYKAKAVDETSPLGVLQHEIEEVCSELKLDKQDVSNDMKEILNGDEALLETYHRVVENVEILRLTSNGDGLATIPHPDSSKKIQIVVVPFGLPGDIVTIRVFKSHPYYVESDLLKVEQPSKSRNDDLINCRYFGKCSGCQYQNVEYDQQLLFKRDTIINAYKYFAKNIQDKLPTIDNTEPSPLQYSYRTKLTPHFNIPFSRQRNNQPLQTRPDLGFGSKGKPTWRETDGGSGSIVDIEECSIGTPIINQGMKNERATFEKEFNKYKKGATILLREDTKVVSSGESITIDPEMGSTDDSGKVSKLEVKLENSSNVLLKTCVTKSRQIVTEYINGFTFEFSAGEFFQNNNSILPAVTNYVKSNLTIKGLEEGVENYLVDAYCGSGLFSITCSQGVSKVIGVEVSADSVKFAERNAKLNNVENAKFIVGKAEAIFGEIDTPHAQTSVILDPPRKGCDAVFLNQLSEFNPAKIVYISCNVHSQARDVDWFLTNTKNGHKYQVESIKGFDFFPQTHHVESVAVLSLR